MYVQPNGHIKLLTGVRLNNTYENTIFFSSKEAQTSYFSSKAKISFDNQSYTRAMDGIIKVQCTPDQIYDCNYLMFQNEGFGNKWFYAFINKVKYINNNCCEVRFEIDVMQTWFFEFNISESFVEREHSLTDGRGDNILDEDVGTGTLLSTNKTKTNLIKNYSILIGTAYDENLEEGDDIPVCKVGVNMVNGLTYKVFGYSNSTEEDVINMLEQFQRYIYELTINNKLDSIVSITIIPSDYNSVLYQITSSGSIRQSDLKFKDFAYDIPTSFKYGDGTVYTPRNKKLLTYPFCYLTISTGSETKDYRFEWFNRNPIRQSSKQVSFTSYCPYSLNPEVNLLPLDYNEGYFEPNSVEYNLDEKLVMTGFPQMAYTCDTYRAWLAQSAAAFNIQSLHLEHTNVMSEASTIKGLADNILSPNISGTFDTIFGGIANRDNYKYTKAMLQNQKNVALSKGSASRGSQGAATDIATGLKDFYAFTMCPTLENAKAIDDYFDMYGYACGRVKDPNISSRPHWNYVKTIGANIIGTAPTDDAAKISSIFDSGITFWKNGDEVGDYYNADGTHKNNAPV